MPTIYELKERAVTETPLLLFNCALPGRATERWSTHRVTVDGADYEARVLQHNVFEMQTASEQGVDGIPKITITLANADSHFSEIERAAGWKGARLTVEFLFYDLRAGTAASERAVLFQGVCSSPEEMREATFRITATNRMNLQRVLLPQIRIQRRCPWEFPSNEAQREEAVNGGTQGKYSRFYRCGYSAGVAGGTGSLNGSEPFTSCGYTRTECEARGMFAHFGGIEFVPPAISVRTAGDKNWHTSAVSVNAARYNDFVPLVYGTAWYTPPVVFARNDGNLTRMEALLGAGEMAGVLKVLVSDVEIPLGIPGTNMTGTGWYNIPTLGARAGVRNQDFTDSSGQPAGDPYGSMAYLSVVTPNRLNDGTSLPRVKVLVQGLKVPTYATSGAPLGEQFTANPAWILLDVLRRAGWSEGEIDIASFARAAAACDEEISALDLYGNAITLPRFQCNLALQDRKSAGDLARGVRVAGRLLLTYGVNGLLRIRVEDSIAREQPEKPAWSNSASPVNGGWPTYEFGDGSAGFTGILKRADGEPAFRGYSRGMADTPNRFMVEFQDALNEYQQDSFSVVDPDDVARSGQEVSATLAAIGIPNFDQAARILKLNLDKSVKGNAYIEFDTSVKSFGVWPGDLITVTYLKEGFNRQLFRALKVAPGANHRVSTITARIHDDAWYTDSNGQPGSSSGAGRQGGAGIGVPKPLMGTVVDEFGEIEFGIEEGAVTNGDGAVETNVAVKCTPPPGNGEPGPGIPLVSLTAAVAAGGTLEAGQAFYYGVAGVDEAGNESELSFLVRAGILSDGSQVTLTKLSFAPGTTAFNVYRGTTPAQLFRIATGLAIAAAFTDNGLPKQLIAPRDSNFDHANYYWRLEKQPECSATIHGANAVGSEALEMAENAYRGALARITRGKGAGQERGITSNTATTLTVSPAWAVAPDASSYWVVAESGWRFGSQTKSGSASFTIPNRSGEVVEITGRSANVNDVECEPELSIVTRWVIGGSGTGDSGAPPLPFFGLGLSKRGGGVELSGVSFTELQNTRTISAATLNIYYWDELRGAPGIALRSAAGSSDAVIDLGPNGDAQAGSYLQVGSEVMRVEERLNGGAQYKVSRGAHGSAALAHGAGELVYHLQMKTTIAPFPPDFFGSSYSGSWSFPVLLSDARIASAELYVTNVKGNSETASACFTARVDKGLRTLSGGQYSIQSEGFLAVDNSVAPVLVIEDSHAVRDVFAVLGNAADAEVRVQVKVDGALYCGLTFAAGLSLSSSVNGNALPPLMTGSKVTVSVLSTGTAYPGADLTVLIRL
jgi:hypothetical protein